jgi:glycosyltransferase involved in cell wall biosynthesis
MKTVIVGPVYPYRGGIAHHTTLMARSLEAAGHQVTVISFRRQYLAWLYPGKTDRDASQQKLEVPALYLLDPLFPWTWLATAERVIRARPDLVVIQWWTPFWAPAFAVLARRLRRRGIPVTFLIHNVLPHETRVWDRWLGKWALSAGSRFIVQTEKEAGRLRALIPRASFALTPLPIYGMFVGQDAIGQPEARQKLEVPPGARVLLFFGIVRPYKGLRYLLDAMALLMKSGQEYLLLVAGEFWEPVGQYAAQIEALGIADRVKIYNEYIPNEDLPVFFAAANVFVAPYTDGTQSAAAKMALGFDLPVVVTRCLVDETLARRPNVWVAPERDARALADAVESAFDKQAGRTTHPPENDWDRLVRTIEEVCQMEKLERG